LTKEEEEVLWQNGQFGGALYLTPCGGWSLSTLAYEGDKITAK